MDVQGKYMCERVSKERVTLCRWREELERERERASGTVRDGERGMGTERERERGEMELGRESESER